MATAFAVLCETDGTLIFYKRDYVPSAGEIFEGRSVTAVYTNVETTTSGNSNYAPWRGDSRVIHVSFADIISPNYMRLWFRMCSKLETFDGTNLDTSKVDSMSELFYGCDKLISADVSGFDTSNVTRMDNMFYACTKLTSLDVTNFDTKNVTHMNQMFSQCFLLPELDLSSFDTSKVINMSYMFYGLMSATKIYVSDKWSIEKVTNSENMFFYCPALSGDIVWSESVVDKTYATYTSGYLTYKRYIEPVMMFIKNTTLYDIADAIREKTGSTETILARNFPEAIAAIDTHEDLEPELATQDDLIEQITTTLSRKIPENLRDELDTLDDLIAQIATALEGKTGASGGASVEIVTGTINFYTPWYPYVFCYEDNNGNVNVFETSDDNFHTFNIRKNSIISFHCPRFASDYYSITSGLYADVLESVNGLEIISITKLEPDDKMFSVAICKATDDFSIDWTDDEGP